MKFLTDVQGTISDVEAGTDGRVELTKYLVLTEDGDLFLSGITHGELIKLAGQLISVAVQDAIMYTYAGNENKLTYTPEAVALDYAGLMEAAISYDGKI